MTRRDDMPTFAVKFVDRTQGSRKRKQNQHACEPCRRRKVTLATLKHQSDAPHSVTLELVKVTHPVTHADNRYGRNDVHMTMKRRAAEYNLGKSHPVHVHPLLSLPILRRGCPFLEPWCQSGCGLISRRLLRAAPSTSRPRTCMGPLLTVLRTTDCPGRALLTPRLLLPIQSNRTPAQALQARKMVMALSL